MKLSKPLLILSGACLGLTLLTGEHGANCAPTKAQLLLRQKLSELNNSGSQPEAPNSLPTTTDSLPSKAQLLADIQRLHDEGKISDEQFEAFKKNINEQYGVQANAEAQAKAAKILEQQQAGVATPKVALPAPVTEAQAKAERVLNEKLKEPQTATLPRLESSSGAEQILRQKIAELNAGQQAAAPPAARATPVKTQAKAKPAPQPKPAQPQTAASIQPESSSVAEQILRQKIAELNAGQQTAASPAAPQTEAKAKPALQPKSAPREAAAPPAAPKAQAKAKPAPQPKPGQPKTAASPQPETRSVAKQISQQKTAADRTPEKTNIVPSSTTATLAPDSETNARELLRMRIAELRKSGVTQPEPDSEAQARALAALHQQEAELKAGITADTPEQARILRLKIAESKGIITPADASRTPVAQTAGAAVQVAVAPSGAASATAPRATAAIGASPVAFQTSNKVGLARLNELTELYKADKITPYEYHHERAKIVASL